MKCSKLKKFLCISVGEQKKSAILKKASFFPYHVTAKVSFFYSHKEIVKPNFFIV